MIPASWGLHTTDTAEGFEWCLLEQLNKEQRSCVLLCRVHPQHYSTWIKLLPSAMQLRLEEPVMIPESRGTPLRGY
ncbi:hypothetical protein I79_001081 [Cricetulus griseus]|uniref:Uncharacterized protein n=1 Tax=Cricetulus griseus TaxID=10029 RepID=G3GTU2_CRIGR|nr:hypothetical protein I79_001081 [Cricetulus griseus]